jgi:hypothetical protein
MPRNLRNPSKGAYHVSSFVRGSLVRRGLAVVLAGLLTAPPVGSSASLGVVRGVVTTSGRPLSGVTVALIDVDSGRVERTTSADTGAFEAKLAPGQYVVTTEGQAGLSVGQGPGIIPVSAGQTVQAHIELVAVNLPPAQEPPPLAGAAPVPPAEAPPAALPESKSLSPVEAAPPSSAPLEQQAGTPGAPVINHEPVACFVVGEFPLLDARIEPTSSVARARVYFKSALGTSYYFVEMTATEGVFQGKLPRPRIEASPIEYYIQATTAEFVEAQTPQVSARVVEKAEDCEGKVAAYGPSGPVQVFSAATGAALNPAGFAAGGIGIAAGTLALILGGAAAAGIAAAVTVFNPSPTPSPSASPTATPHPPPTPPPPTPTPEPSPKPPKSPPPVSPFN